MTEVTMDHLSRSCKQTRESRQVGTTEQCLASTSSGGGWLRAPQSSSEFPRRKEETRSRQCLGHTPGTLVLLGRGLVCFSMGAKDLSTFLSDSRLKSRRERVGD